MTHNILVNAYCIAPDRIVAGTAGSYGLERMALTFSEEWKDVAKTVTFYPPKSRPVSVVLTDGDEFDIPHEATAKSGEISFTVLGYRDGKRIFSVTGEMLVLATKNKEGVPSEEPTPSEKEQILAYVQDVKEMIDAGKIKGEDGESVTITDITESDEDGGSNVVTFSDGKTLTVKNGNKGGDGEGGGNSVYFSEEEPTDAKTGDFWYDESEEEEATQPLTFTGAVEATYDGSQPVVVEVPDTAIPRIEMASTDTTATIEPNRLYVFPEMASLDITLGGDADISVVQEYRFRFTSGATATTLTLPADVVGEISVEANKVYEVSILDGYLVSQSWEVS